MATPTSGATLWSPRPRTPEARGGALLQLVDPQPDAPACEVCSLHQRAADLPEKFPKIARFAFLAQRAPQPAKEEVIHTVQLKVTYTDGTPTQYLRLPATADPPAGAATTPLGQPRHVLAEAAYFSPPLRLDGPFARVDTVTVVGLTDHPNYSQAVVFVESAAVDR